MDVSLFDYYLPKELIAQAPLAMRSQSRLMVLQRAMHSTSHTRFSRITQYLAPGDVLVLNDTRVRHARLIGQKEETGGKIEVLLLDPLGKDRWEALIKPSRRVKIGTTIIFGKNDLICTVEKALPSIPGGHIVYLTRSGKDSIEEVIERVGKAPLPPYIQQELTNQERYQTVFSKKIGSSAAPTAGLHFTQDLLSEMQKNGVMIASITLHVGLGTFRPVVVDQLQDHTMHREFYELSASNAKKIRDAKKRGNKVVGVGTTSVRALETIAQCSGEVKTSRGFTDIFIYPGFSFQVIDGLITNFHLPRSTLLMLVSAFYTREKIIKAYEEAVRERYRFFSFGDAMLIL